jgi:large subunit ribosomal protein L23
MSAIANQERLMGVLLGPHLSEKSTRVGEIANQVVFRVRTDSTKQEVRRAVELLFEVQVEKVRMVNCRGKVKRFGQTTCRRQDWKKAYVTLAEGNDIDFLGAD